MAVNCFPGEFPRTAGSLLLVNYFHFLRKNYYPRHDALCRAESEAMLQALADSAMDKGFVDFINRPGRITGDTPMDLSARHYASDREKISAIAVAKAKLDKEFWNSAE